MKLNELMEKYGDYEVKDGFMDLLEKPKPKTVWDLKEGDEYWYVDIYGDVFRGVWSSPNNADALRRDQGNVFLTKEEAKFEKKKCEIYTKVKKYAYEFSKEEWENKNLGKYFPCYDHELKKLFIDINNIFQGGYLYFTSEVDIQKAIDEVGENDFIRYYLGVEL
ncbi:MAG: hypothetical protein ACLRT4_13785 [Thomasclavelia sp.]